MILLSVRWRGGCVAYDELMWWWIITSWEGRLCEFGYVWLSKQNSGSRLGTWKV